MFCKVISSDGHTVYTGTLEQCNEFVEMWWDEHPGMTIISDN